MRSDVTTRYLTYSAIGIVVNIVFGTAVSMLKIPLLFLDTIGTIFIAATLGPWYGAATGLLTNVIQGIMTNPKSIPFALVNVAIALVVGFVSKRWKFDYKTAFFTGLALAVVAPLIGTPISIYLFGGLTGGGTDILFMWMLKSGNTIFSAAFLPRIWSNLIDKIASALLVAYLIKQLPIQYTQKITPKKPISGEQPQDC